MGTVILCIVDFVYILQYMWKVSLFRHNNFFVSLLILLFLEGLFPHVEIEKCLGSEKKGAEREMQGAETNTDGRNGVCILFMGFNLYFRKF